MDECDKLPESPGINNRILAFGDTHHPYSHKDSLAFLKKLKELYNPTRIIHMGDEIDHHAMSFHDSDPNVPYTASSELHAAIRYLEGLYDLFPVCDVLDSNHGSMALRKAKVSGIPIEYLKPTREVLRAPNGWVWHHRLRLTLPTGNDCLFAHQMSANALTAAQKRACSLMLGHNHEKQGIQFWGAEENPFFAGHVGCLVDSRALAMAYRKENANDVRLGATLILNGMPMSVPMLLDKENRWVGRSK